MLAGYRSDQLTLLKQLQLKLFDRFKHILFALFVFGNLI